MAFEPSTTVSLPIGIEVDGARVREVTIDRMAGYDTQNIANAKCKKNGAYALSTILRRCIQHIPGVVEGKKDRRMLIPESVVQGMYTPDRDFLFMAINALVKETQVDYAHACTNCGEVWDNTVDLVKLDVYEWPDDEPLEIETELPFGIEIEGQKYRDVVLTYMKGGFQERLLRLPEADQVSTIMTGVIERVVGYPHKLDSAVALSMSDVDMQHVMTTLREEAPGLDLRRVEACPKCGHENDYTVEVSRFFTNPARGAKDRKPTNSDSKTRQKRRKRT